MIDLNEPTTTKQKDAATFGDEIYQQLPPLIGNMVDVLNDETEKSVFLMGALGTLSGMLPNIQGVYDGQTIYPNLYVYVIGPYGSGKGALSYSRALGQAVHRVKLDETLQAKEDRGEDDPEPPQRLHYIPANNSKTGFFELLNANDGSGTLFESEGDTLADAIRQDYGNFSDGLRKGFHHEPISFYRRANREFVEIDNPRLSVVLSSTFDQMQTLIPTTENGLFSRFCFFNLRSDPTFKNVFAAGKIDYQDKFRRFGLEAGTIYKFLEGQPDPVIFQLTEDQQIRFLAKFQALKDQVRQDITADMDGAVNRLGLQFYRIAMILTAFRGFGADGLNNPLVCDDMDFELTGRIIDVLAGHAIEVYLNLPQPQEFKNKHLDKAEDIRRAVELHQSGQTYAAISNAIFGNTDHKSTVYRWIKNK